MNGYTLYQVGSELADDIEHITCDTVAECLKLLRGVLRDGDTCTDEDGDRFYVRDNETNERVQL